MIGVDTNVLVRYLTQDDAAQSSVATRFVEHSLSSTRPGHVSLVALAETICVLRARYGATDAELIELVQQLASDGRFVVQDQRAVWLALEAVEDGGADLPDALIAYVDREHGCSHTVTFDKRASRIAGMTLLR